MSATISSFVNHMESIKMFVGGSKESKSQLFECYIKYHGEKADQMNSKLYKYWI